MMASKTSFIFIAFLALVLAFAGCIGNTGTQSFTSSDTLVISQVPGGLNGQDMTMVLMSAGGPSTDGIVGNLDKSTYPMFNSDESFVLQASRIKDTYQYTATDRQGSSGTVYTYTLTSQCTGLLGTGSCLGISINTFRANCKAPNSNNIFYDAGDLANPKWRCYSATPKWIVSDFNNIGGTSNPEIQIILDQWTNGSTFVSGGHTGNVLAQYTTTLTPTHTRDVLLYQGTLIGYASITSLQSTFLSPPSSSGIKALRPAGTNTNYMLVSGAVVDEWTYDYTTFQSCMTAARNPSGGQLVITAPMGFIPFGLTYSESTNDQLAQGCISALNSQATQLAYLMPQGDFQGADSSSLNTNKIVKLNNAFTIPQVKFELFADKVGIIRPVATPSSISCNDKQLPGGSSTGEFTVNAANGPVAGGLDLEFSCTNPLTVRTPASTYYFNQGETKQLSVAVSLSPNSGSSTCTVKAYDTNHQNPVVGTCTISQTGACNNTPTWGYLDVNCHEYCPLTANDCPYPKVLKTPGTGYPNTCLCENANTTPNPCNNNGVCEFGETVANCPTDCGVVPPGPGPSQCDPIFQKPTTQTVGGIVLFGMNFGGTSVGMCATNYTNIGLMFFGVALVLLVIGFAMKRQGKMLMFMAAGVGAVGALLILLDYVVANSGALLMAGVGIALIAIVGGIAWLYIKR